MIPAKGRLVDLSESEPGGDVSDERAGDSRDSRPSAFIRVSHVREIVVEVVKGIVAAYREVLSAQCSYSDRESMVLVF